MLPPSSAGGLSRMTASSSDGANISLPSCRAIWYGAALLDKYMHMWNI